MASSTTRLSFTFFNFSTPQRSLHLKPHLTFFPNSFHPPKSLTTSIRSIDVDKQEQPISPSPSSEQETDQFSDQKLDKKRPEEKFAVVNTGIYECRSCGYKYNESTGDPSYPIPPGLPFDKLPDDWRCPTCGASQSFFESKSMEIAGFAQNQQFGLGGNTLTSGQKALLIYGGLLLGFALFLSGYFLQ